MKEVRLDLFKLHDENDKGKGRIKVVLDRAFYRKCLEEIRDHLKIKNKDISREFGLPYFNFMKNLQNDKLPIFSLEKLINLYCKTTKMPKSTVNKLFSDKIRKLICNSGKAFSSSNYVSCLTKNLCKIAGAIATDGCLYIDGDEKGNGYIIELSDYYESNVKLFCYWVYDVFGVKINYSRHKNDKYFDVRFKNKIVFRYLNKVLNIPHGAKSKIVRMPELIRGSNLEYRKAFVSAALIFDGGVIFKSGYYQFASQSLLLIRDIKNVLLNFDIEPDYNEPRDQKFIYRFVIRDKKKLKKLLKYFVPITSSKYLQLRIHLGGFGKLSSLEEVVKKLDYVYPRFGKSVIFSDIIHLVSDGKPFDTDLLTRKLSKSQDVIKKSLNKLEKWNILSSNNSRGKVNKVWYINPNLKTTDGGDKI